MDFDGSCWAPHPINHGVSRRLDITPGMELKDQRETPTTREA